MQTASRGFFFFTIGILGIALVIAIYQVPQPWRGVLVAWVLFAGTAGAFVMRVAKHHYRYKSQELAMRPKRRAQQAQRRSTSRRRTAAPRGLRVVVSDRSAAGRHTI